MIDIEYKNKIPPAKGKLLISEPFLDDQYFKRSVVLLCEHNDKGSFGFVLNHYLDLSIHEIVPEFPDVDSKVSVGGPVGTDSVYYIHNVGESVDGSAHVIDNVFMGGDFATLKTQLEIGAITADQIRLFVGYSGWSPGQLDEELENNAWIVADTTGNEIMNTSIDKMWKKTLARQGKKYKMISTFPENFRLN